MNTQKIKFGNKNIEVQGCYPYLVSTVTGKVVLKITANEADTTFEELHSLADNESGEIEFYIREASEQGLMGDWELKTIYEDYNSGDVHIAYQNGVYDVEVTRVDGVVKEQAKLRADVDFLNVWTDAPV